MSKEKDTKINSPVSDESSVKDEADTSNASDELEDTCDLTQVVETISEGSEDSFIAIEPADDPAEFDVAPDKPKKKT